MFAILHSLGMFVVDWFKPRRRLELAELRGVEVDMMLQVAADLNRAVDYEAIATAFGEHRDVRRLRTELEALGFAIDQRGA